MSNLNKLKAQAAALFKRFHKREPEPDELVEATPVPREVLLLVGDLVGVIYKADNQEYIHKFKATDRPELFVSSDGHQAYIVAGRYVFTERGFID